MKVRLLAALILLAAGTVCLAQESRGTVTGTVVDPQGAAVPGATVVAKHLATNVETRTTTNEAGLYVLPFLNTGQYSVTVTAPGFRAAVREPVELGIGARQQVDFKLQIGAITEQVTVSATAELLNTTNAIRATTLDARKIADLPLLGKNPYTLAYHGAGVLHINPQGSITDRPYDNGGMDAINIAGGRAFTNEYLLDGAPNTNTERGRANSLSFVPPPEATEELSVLANNYDAQYGRTGGGVISATLKSGTNKLHGSVYEYHRNRVLNANTFQANRQGQPRGPFIWNQPGATVSGPVYIPKLYDGRNRTFFLFSWEAIKQNIPNNPLHTVPSLLNRTGDFSDLRQSNGNPIIIYDPLTTGQGGGANIRIPFPGNKLPADRLDPVALKILDYIPKPNFTPNAQGFQNYSPQSGLVTRERYNAYTTKIDQVLTSQHRLAGMYVRNRRWQTGPDYGWPKPVMGPNNFQRFNQGASLQLTSTLSAAMVVSTRFGFTQHDFANFMYGGGFDPVTLGFPANQVRQAQGQFFPTLSFTDYTGFGQGGNNHDTSTNWYLTVAANRVAGRHSVKFGGEFRVLLDNQPAYSFASFSFTRGFTQRDYATGDAGSGNAMASFLLGYPASGSSPFNPTPAWGNHYYGLYIQDDWRVARNLTINLGGRWDYDSPYTERFNRANAGFDLTSPSPLKVPGLDLKGGLLFVSPSNRLTYKRDLNNFQPRLGMAWQFRSTTVFRAGYGMSYVPVFTPGYSGTSSPYTYGFSASTPYVASNDANRTPAGRFSNPFPEGILRPTGSQAGLATFAGQSISYIYQDRVVPYIQQYSAGFQQQLPGRMVLDVSYVGSQTRKLGTSKNINDITAEQLALGTSYLNASVSNPFAGLLPGTGLNSATTTRRQLLRPYPQFVNITRNEYTIGKGWYNSLQIQLEKRLSHGLHFQIVYTWSTTMEAASYLNNQFNDQQLERVRVAEDLPHRMSIFGGYEIPFFKGATGLRRALLGGWQVQAIALFQTGRQLNGVDAYWTGVSPFISGPKVPDGYYFNACSVNTQGVRQNCATADQPVVWRQRPSDTLRVAGSRWHQLREMRPALMDSSVFKTFPVRESVQIQFRMEAFNTFNTPWFGQANTSFGNARFGLLGNSQTNDPRNLQAALKISF